MSNQDNQDFQQAPGAGFTSDGLQGSSQGPDSGYDQMAGSQNDQGMGGGYGAPGSGVAGGYDGNQSQASGQNPQSQQAPAQGGAEKKDWLDKGIASIGKKFGMNVVSDPLYALQRTGADGHRAHRKERF